MRANTFRIIVAGLLFLTASNADAQEMRTWTDSTGKNKMEASFVSLEDGVVILLNKNGKKFEIKLEKLSKADQTFAKEQADNPFREAEDSPFTPSQGMKKESGEKETEGSAGKMPIKVDVDPDNSEEIRFLDEVEWSYVPAGLNPASTKYKIIPLPKRANIFEDLTNIAPNLAAGKVAFGLTTGKPGEPKTTRIFLGDLTTGRANNPLPVDAEYAPLALHHDGKHVALRTNAHGLHEKSTLLIADISGKQMVIERSAVAYDNEVHTDIEWAAFAGDNLLLTISNGGKLVGWDFETLQPEFHLTSVFNCRPALSPDHQVLACYVDQQIVLVDLQKREAIGIIQVPRDVPQPGLAFSPSGSRIACAGLSEVLIWDGKTGELQRDINVGFGTAGKINFPDEDYLLLANTILLNTENEIPLWNYHHSKFSWSENGTTILAGSSSPTTGGVYSVRLPHPEATKLMSDVQTKPELLAFRAGDSAKIDVSGVPAEHQERVRKGLEKQLKALGSSVSDSAPVTFIATITGPQQRAMRFMFVGDVQVQEYISKVELQYQGKRAWGSTSTNIPGIVTYKRGENLESKLKELGQSPNLNLFDGVRIPKYVLKPGLGGNSSGATLGSSVIDRK